MKKILVLFGSPHENGKTKKLLDSFIELIEKQFSITLFDVYNERFVPCIDCGKCKKSGHCGFNDLQKLNIELESCDIIVIASPLYNLGLPGPLKSVLDRFQVYYNFYVKNNVYKIEKKKKAFLLLTSGRRKDDFVVEAIKKQLNSILKYLNAKISGKIIWDNTDESSELNKQQLEEIKKTANTILG